MIAALFVETDGAYFGLPDVDPWDAPRDARTYSGPHPVVAHPPCNRWAQPLAQVNETRYGHRVGDDGGCFESALRSVRAFGGVLEHPASTAAWARFDLPKAPTDGGWVRGFCGGWCCYVEQANYGHPARKPTLLYAFGVELPDMRWGRAPDEAVTATVSWLRDAGPCGQRPRITKHEASRSPEAFRDALLSIARSARSVEAA